MLDSAYLVTREQLQQVVRALYGSTRFVALLELFTASNPTHRRNIFEGCKGIHSGNITTGKEGQDVFSFSTKIDSYIYTHRLSSVVWFQVASLSGGNFTTFIVDRSAEDIHYQDDVMGCGFSRVHTRLRPLSKADLKVVVDTFKDKPAEESKPYQISSQAAKPKGTKKCQK